jgi:hypothetical protein
VQVEEAKVIPFPTQPTLESVVMRTRELANELTDTTEQSRKLVDMVRFDRESRRQRRERRRLLRALAALAGLVVGALVDVAGDAVETVNELVIDPWFGSADMRALIPNAAQQGA